MPKLYDELAPWWPLMSAPGDDEEEAASMDMRWKRLSGTGPHTRRARQRRRKQRVTSEIAIQDGARGTISGNVEGQPALNPECQNVQGDSKRQVEPTVDLVSCTTPSAT